MGILKSDSICANRRGPALALASLGVACLALSAASTPASAATIQVQYADQAATYTPAGVSSLIYGQLPGYSTPEYTFPNGGSTVDLFAQGGVGLSQITSGTYSGGRDAATVGQYNGGGTGGYSGGDTVIYNLAASSNLTSVNFIFGWNDAGRNAAPPVAIYVNPSTNVTDPNDPNWTLLSNALSPTGYTTSAYQPGVGVLPLVGTAEVDYQGSPPANANNDEVTVSGLLGGDIADGVGSIEFFFGPAENSFAGLGQAEVFGTAVPEPATLSLLTLATLPLLARRRQPRR